MANLLTNNLIPIARYGPAAYILALMGAYICTAQYSAVHLDITRDSLVALEILSGKSLPLEGPVLAGQVHLGPVWFYLLAALFQIGDSWSSTIKWLFLLASTQFPLAYLAGRALHDRTAGILWATFLFIPSWSLFEQVFPTHTLFTAPAALATLYFLVRFFRERQIRFLAVAGASFSFALHAHPTALILLPLFAGCCFWALVRGKIGLVSGMAIAVSTSVLFSPRIVSHFANGKSVVDMVKTYSQSGQFDPSLASLPKLVWETSVGGLHYLLSGMSGLGISASWLIVLSFALLIFAGLGAVIVRSFRGDPICIVVTVSLICGALIATALRTSHPYYMTTALRVLLYGGAALGISYLLLAASPFIKSAVGVIAIFCIGLNAYAWAAIAQWQSHGDWPVAAFPLFDVKRPWQPTQLITLMSAKGMDAIGSWLCQSDLTGLHGPIGIHLIHSYSLEARLSCPSHAKVTVGGTDDRQRWIGISSRMAERLHVTPQFHVGAFAISPVRRSLNGRAAIVTPSHAGFPPISTTSRDRTELVIETQIAPKERLAITNFAWLFAPDPAISVTVGGKAVQPSASDWMTTIYECKSCLSESVQVRIKDIDPRLIDVVLF